MLDYQLFLRESVSDPIDLPQADIFVSAYTWSERVQRVFRGAPAETKVWAIHPHYEFDAELELAIQGGDNAYRSAEGADEAEFALGLCDHLEQMGLSEGTRLVIDITGLVRPELMALVHVLWHRGIRRFSAVYSEPQRYERKSRTQFSRGPISVVRQVLTFEASHTRGDHNELMILGTGYDVNPMKAAADHKSRAKKVVLLGMPSLVADMYQENVLRVDKAGDSIGIDWGGPSEYFAGANDPFGTAMTLRKIVEKEDSLSRCNIYFCPTGTKPQVLGFVLFYLHERRSRPWSIIYPFSARYNPETALGLGRIWVYEVALDTLRNGVFPVFDCAEDFWRKM